MPLSLRFPNANLTVVLEGNPVMLTATVAALHYKEPTEPPRMAFREDGSWADPLNPEKSLDGIALNQASHPEGQSRLLIRNAGDNWEIMDGTIPLQPLAGHLEKVLGPGLAKGGLWLSAEGVVVRLDNTLVMPPGTSSGLAAVFQWRSTNPGPGSWWWRLLPQWPRKEDSADQNLFLPAHVGNLLQSLAEAFGLEGRELLVPDFALAAGETPARRDVPATTDAGGPPLWRVYTRTPDLDEPWWSLPLSATTLQFAGPADRNPEAGVTAHSPGEQVILEIRPTVLHCYRGGFSQTGKIRYVLVEDHGSAVSESPGTNASELSLSFEASRNDEGGRLLAAHLDPVKKVDLIALAPDGDALAPPEFWLRERSGFVQLRAGLGEAGLSPRWPTSQIPRESRQARISAWLPPEQVTGVDLWLLPDNCSRLEASFEFSQDQLIGQLVQVAVSLRVVEPGLRLVTGAHALVQSPPVPAIQASDSKLDEIAIPSREGLEPSAFPPMPTAASAGGQFHPLVWLSPALATQVALAPFSAQLLPPKKGRPLALQLSLPESVEWWQHQPFHPVVAPVDWAINDPAARGGMSALRGLWPVRYWRPTKAALALAVGGVELVIEGTPEVPLLCRGETLGLLDADDDRFIELLLGAIPGNPDDAKSAPDQLTFRRRHAPPLLDQHYRQSLPGGHPGQTLPADFAWVHDRLRPGSKSLALRQVLSSTKVLDVVRELREANLVPPSSPIESRIHKFQQFAVTLLDGSPLFHLGVRFDSEGRRPVRWTLADPAGRARPALAGLDVYPLHLEGKTLTVSLVSPAAELNVVPWPLAGPGQMTFELDQDVVPAPSGDTETRTASVGRDHRTVLPGRLFLERIAPGSPGLEAAAKRLLAVTSASSTVTTGADGPDLVLSDLEYWFRIEGELFSIQTKQSCVLRSKLTELQPGALTVDAEGHFEFGVSQILPGGLTIGEKLLSTRAEKEQMLQLYWGSSNQTFEYVATAAPSDGVHEFASAPLADDRKNYHPLSGQQLALGLPIELNRLTRVYLRFRRRPAGTPDRAFDILGGMLGWTAQSVWKLKGAQSQSDPQITLYFSEADLAHPILRLNGTLAWPIELTGSGRLELKLVLWDGELNLAWDPLDPARLELPKPASINVLIDAALRTNRSLYWSAFQTIVFASDRGLVLQAIFGIEQPPKDAGSMIAPDGVMIRRPDSQLLLWPTPATAPELNSSVIISMHVEFGSRATVTRQNLRAFAVTDWKDFSLEENLRDRTLGDSPGKFPGPTLRSVAPVMAPNTVNLIGDLTELAGVSAAAPLRAVGYSLFEDPNHSGGFWLRCPVRELKKENLRPAPPAAVWVWKDGRIEKLWALERPVDGILDPSVGIRLAGQVLRFARWHRNAILETPADPGSFLVEWRLFDSPLLNRELELTDFTDTNALTGQPRFGVPDHSVTAQTEFLNLATRVPSVGVANVSLAQLFPERSTAENQPWKIADWTAPCLYARATVGAPNLGAGNLEDHVIVLSRSVPFQRDGPTASWFYDWPIAPWYLGGYEPPGPVEGRGAALSERLRSTPLAPVELHLSLSSPRPGERIAFDLTALAVVTGTGFAPGALCAFGHRSPLGENLEEIRLAPAERLDPSGPPPPYRDHLVGYRQRWVRTHSLSIKPGAGTPLAVALIHPHVAGRRVSESEWFPVLATTTPPASDTSNEPQILLVLAPDQDDGGEFHFEVVEEISRSAWKVRGRQLGLPMGGVGIRSGTLLQVRITRADSAKEMVEHWNVCARRIPGSLTAPSTVDFATAELVPTVPGDLRFAVSDIHSAAMAAALLGLIRVDPNTGARRTAAFGTEGDSQWQPYTEGEAIRWSKEGQFDDYLPVDLVPADGSSPRYELVVMLGDGSVFSTTRE